MLTWYKNLGYNNLFWKGEFQMKTSMINVDGRHILATQKAERFEDRMRIAFCAVAVVVVASLCMAYNSYARLPEKAVCANSAGSTKLDTKFSPYYVECGR